MCWEIFKTKITQRQSRDWKGNIHIRAGINHSSQDGGLRSIILKERNKLLQQMCDHFFTTICTYY